MATKITADKIIEINRLYKVMKTYAAVARELGISASTVKKYVDPNFEDIPVDIPKIALIHSPIRLTDDNVFEHLKAYDVILTGHTHNGMIPDSISNILPGNWGIVSPNKKLFPKIARGKIVKEETTIIVNGSITKLSLLSGKSLHRFNFVYDASVNKILIRKKEK